MITKHNKTNCAHTLWDTPLIYTNIWYKIYIYFYWYIKNNAWVTVNNDFFVTSEAIRQWFSRVTKSEWKSLSNRLMSDKKLLFTVTNVLFYFLHDILCHEHTNPLKNYHRALISPLLPRAAFSDRALWRHHNWSVTSCEREILVLWRHICLLSLHAQIGAKAIFTSE